MTKREKKLIKAFEDVVWMAIRYAHGRQTYAPSLVRKSVEAVKSVDPSWVLWRDHTLKPMPEDLKSFHFKSTYLNDLFE